MSVEDDVAREMLGHVGAVGATTVQARYPGGVGAAQVQAHYPGVGIPAEAVPSPGPQTMRYSPTRYNAGEVTYMGLGTTTVPANSTTEIEVRPNRPFTPQAWYMPSNIQELEITQVSVGGVGLLAGEAGLPCELYSEISKMPQILWPSLDPAVGIKFRVRNPTAQPRDFKGGLYGSSVRI